MAKWDEFVRIALWQEAPEGYACSDCGKPAAKVLAAMQRLTPREFKYKGRTGYALCSRHWGKRNV